MANKNKNRFRITNKWRYPNGGIIKYNTGGNVQPLSTYQIRDNIQYQQPMQSGMNTAYNVDDFYSSYDMSGSVANSYTQQPQQQSTGMSNMGTYGMIAQGLGQVGSSISYNENPYNTQYGYQTSGTAQAAQSTPIGSVIGGVAELAGSAAEALGAVDYNEYGVNQSGDVSGAIYESTAATLDPMSQLEKDIAEDDWWSAAGTLVGGQIFTGVKQYYDDQDEAKKVEAEARKAEALKQRQLREQNPQMTNMNPTMTYPDGGTIDSTGRYIVGTYGKLNNQWSKDTSFIPGDVQKYETPTYVGYTPSTGDSLGGMDVLNRTTFSQDSTVGPKATYYRTYKDKNTGTDYQIPIFDTDTFNKYFPESKSAKYPMGGQIQQPNAELETDEVFRTPDGQIAEVPEGTPSHKQGGVKMTLPEGTEILGKMKGKYTNGKSYKELGQSLKDKYDKYSKAANDATTVIGKRTANLMLNKVQKEFDALMADQELISKMPSKMTDWTSDQQGNPIAPTVDYEEPRYAKGGKLPKYENGKGKGEPKDYIPIVNEYGLTENYYKDFLDTYDFTGGLSDNKWIGETSTIENPTFAYGYNEDFTRNEDIIGSPNTSPRNVNSEGGSGDMSGTMNALGTAAQLAPAAYNLYQGIFGKTDKLNYRDYLNPYRGRMLRDLGDINYNIRPELEANELAYQTARRNVRQVAPGVGNILSNYNALAGTRMRADAGAWARKQNMENQLRQQRAGLYGQLGAQEAQTRYNVDLANQGADAAKERYLQAGLTQLGQSAYNMSSANQRKTNQQSLINMLGDNMSNYDIIINPDGTYGFKFKG